MTRHSASIRTSALALLIAALTAGSAAAGAPPPPTASPGELAGFATASGPCPTFSWGAVPEAGHYELALYAVDDGGRVESQPRLHQRLPGSITAWTPPLERCPDPGRRYAWTVRALGEHGPSQWSASRLFLVSEAPSVGEVEEALAVLRRYVAGQSRSLAPGDRRSAAARAPAREMEAEAVPDPAPGALLPGRLDAAPSPRTVVLGSSYSLALDSDLVLAGRIFHQGDETRPLLHTDGGVGFGNTALGLHALESATPGVPVHTAGAFNTAVGNEALRNTTEGFLNSACGSRALVSNTTGARNTAAGAFALFLSTAGFRNTAVGAESLHTLDAPDGFGDNNTAVGERSLFSLSEGVRNTAIGRQAAFNLQLGDDNVAIGANAGVGTSADNRNIAIGSQAGGTNIGSGNIYLGSPSEAGDSDIIRIGSGQTATFVAGVHGALVGNDALQVLVGGLGKLGTMTSSRRFKEEIETMGDASAGLRALRPVTFRYTEEVAGDGPRPRQFGLLAEEVAEVYPALVARDGEGEPYSVRYHVLPVMLLNELQKLRRELEELGERLRAIESPG